MKRSQRNITKVLLLTLVLMPLFIMAATPENPFNLVHYDMFTQDNACRGILAGAGNILINESIEAEFFQDIVAVNSNMEQPLSSEFLRVHFDPEKKTYYNVISDNTIKDYHPPLSSVIIFPNNLEQGRTYHVHYLIGPLFNPEDGFLKPLVLYNIQMLENVGEHRVPDHAVNKGKDPGVILNNIQVKLAVPEDKVTVFYNDIQIRELWDDQMEEPYVAISTLFDFKYEDYLRETGKRENIDDRIKYFNQIARNYFLEKIPLTVEPLEENPIFGRRAKPYLEQTELKNNIDAFTGMFADLSTNALSKYLETISFLGSKETTKGFFDIVDLSEKTFDTLSALGLAWDTFSGTKDPSVFSDLMIHSYDENDYDIVSVEWVDDTPFIVKPFKNKNNVLISIPFRIEGEITKEEIIGNYIAVNYKTDALGDEEYMSQFLPWQRDLTVKLMEEWKEQEPLKQVEESPTWFEPFQGSDEE